MCKEEEEARRKDGRMEGWKEDGCGGGDLITRTPYIGYGKQCSFVEREERDGGGRGELSVAVAVTE